VRIESRPYTNGIHFYNGGVNFIDEAYELMVKDNQNSFNNDALAVLLRYMEDHRKELVVIAAGYEKEMREFLASNIGLTRRFRWVTFEDYTPSEMADIFMMMSERCEENFEMEDPHSILEEKIREITEYYLSHPDSKGRATNGGNGGLVRNIFQEVMFARNNRVADTDMTTMQITMDDIQTGFDVEMQKAINVTS
jgi:Cdc6-like AAA superfamily ATPase